MKKESFLLLAAFLLIFPVTAQVKPSYIYNPDAPGGPLDIRTSISPATYYYLKEGETFSFREDLDGQKTKTFRKFTKWDSSPYDEGHLRYHNGSSDLFVMNYRLLKPIAYSPSYPKGYPLIVFLHGGIERGNCSYHNCYHSTWAYDPNLNAPKASTSATHPLLNNDHHLKFGGEEHLIARNLAGNRLPDDPGIPQRGFSGFVLAPQMFNDWDERSVEHMLRIVQLHLGRYNIDPNRVYIHGLSVGGYAVYEAMNKAPWMFAAAMPICPSRDGRRLEEKLHPRVVSIPIWDFQGEKDLDPSVSTTKAFLSKWKSAGGVARYTEYPGMDHSIFNNAFAEPEFFLWLRSKDKSNIHPLKGNTVIIRSKNVYPRLTLSEGFFAYQWEKDGVILAESSHTLTVASAGTYRARFSRVPNPEPHQWNRWSAPLVVTEGLTPSDVSEELIVNGNTPGEGKTQPDNVQPEVPEVKQTTNATGF